MNTQYFNFENNPSISMILSVAILCEDDVEFKCLHNLKCVSNELHCDGKPDCGLGDDSDEESKACFRSILPHVNQFIN